MLILGIPKHPEDFYIAESDLAFTLQQKGFHPMYRDDDVYYFKKNKKLEKILIALGIED